MKKNVKVSANVVNAEIEKSLTEITADRINEYASSHALRNASAGFLASVYGEVERANGEKVSDKRIKELLDEDTKTIKMLRKAIGGIVEKSMTLGAVCAQLNSILDEEVEIEGVGTMKVHEFFTFVGVDLSKRRNEVKNKPVLTAKLISAVWADSMKDENGVMCAWRKVGATVGDKRVYEFDTKKNDYVAVGTWQLVPVEKWTVRVLLSALFDAWNIYGTKNRTRQALEHIKSVEHFYITESKTATRKNVHTKMREVKIDEIEF